MKLNKSFLLIFFISIIALNVKSQTKYSSIKGINFTVSGTSTLHDWEMKGSGGKCIGTLEFSGSKLSELSDVSFSFPAKQLKSGKDAMDGNAYKSLKVEKFPNIIGSITNAKFTTTDNVNFKFSTALKLQIAGVTKDININADGKLNKDGSFTIKGEKKIDMTEFKVDPPSFMFGSVKTGKDLTIKFDLTLNK